MEDMIAIELAVIIVAMFAIAVGFDCIKDGMCDIGAVIHDIITAPVRHYRQKKLMEQMEREWENYLEKNRAKNGQEFDERAAETFFHEHRRKAHCRGVGKGSGRICGVSMPAG